MRSGPLALTLLLAACGAPGKPPADPPPGVVQCPPAVAAGARVGTAETAPQESLPVDQFIYIDHATTVASRCVQGECPPGPMISSTPPSDLTVDDALKVVYADGFGTSGPAGTGGGGWLFAVSALPYTREDVTIDTISADGRASLHFRGVPIELAAKQRWECQTVAVDQREGHALELTTKIWFVNHGALDKQAISCAQPGRDCQIVVP